MSNKCYYNCGNKNTPKSLFGCETCTTQVLRRNGLQDDICWSYYGPLPDCCCQTCKRQMDLLNCRRNCINFREPCVSSTNCGPPATLPLQGLCCNIFPQVPENNTCCPPCPVCGTCIPCIFQQKYTVDKNCQKMERKIIKECKSAGSLNLSLTVDCTTVSTSSDDLRPCGAGEMTMDDCPYQACRRGTSQLNTPACLECDKSTVESIRFVPHGGADYSLLVSASGLKCECGYSSKQKSSSKKCFCDKSVKCGPKCIKPYSMCIKFVPGPIHNHNAEEATPIKTKIDEAFNISKSLVTQDGFVQTDSVPCFCKSKCNIQSSSSPVEETPQITPVMEVVLTFKSDKFQTPLLPDVNSKDLDESECSVSSPSSGNVMSREISMPCSCENSTVGQVSSSGVFKKSKLPQFDVKEDKIFDGGRSHFPWNYLLEAGVSKSFNIYRPSGVNELEAEENESFLLEDMDLREENTPDGTEFGVEAVFGSLEENYDPRYDYENISQYNDELYEIEEEEFTVPTFSSEKIDISRRPSPATKIVINFRNTNAQSVKSETINIYEDPEDDAVLEAS